MKCFHSWRITERVAAEIKKRKKPPLCLFSLFPADTVAAQSGFSCHLDKLMEITLHPSSLILLYTVLHLLLGHLLL